jgi:hypothetical protein
MANAIFMNDDGFIEVTVNGDQTGESVQAMGEEVKALLEKLKADRKPRLILDDLTHMGNTNIPARQKVAELAKTLDFERVAMVGDGSMLMRVGTNLMLGAIGKGGNIRYFEDRKRAIAWLTKRR